MTDTQQKTDIRMYRRLRRCVLEFLYDRFKALPYADSELADLREACDVSPQELNWNLVYLEKSGFVELRKSADSLSCIATSVAITARGIDIVEDPDAFDRQFAIQPQ